MTLTTHIQMFLAEAALAVASPSSFGTGSAERWSNDGEALAGRHAG